MRDTVSCWVNPDAVHANVAIIYFHHPDKGISTLCAAPARDGRPGKRARVPASVAGTDRRSYVSLVRDRRPKSVDAYYILRNALQLSMQIFPDPAAHIGILVLINFRGQHLVRESLVALV